MEKVNGTSKSNLNIQLPVRIDYRVLNEFLQKKFQGKILSKGKAGGETSDHARIEHISLEKSNLDDYDLAVHLELRLLTSFFKNRKIKAVVHVSLSFREDRQELLIQNYKLDAENNGWLVDTLVETLINTFLYSKLKDKMKYEFRSLIEEKLIAFNQRLTESLEVSEGIFLSGKINQFRIEEIVPGARYLLVSISVNGNNVLDVKNINF